MSIKKIVLGFALAGILGATSAVAEKEGKFVGLNFGSSSIDSTATYTYGNYGSQSATGSASKSRFGVVFGDYAAIDEDMGYRIYGFADMGDDLYNVNANADFLYTFVKFEKAEIRGFAGAYAGAVVSPEGPTIDGKKKIFWGIDAGLNIGARVVFLERHGIDAFYRYGFLTPETEWENDAGTYKLKLGIQQSLAGIRYTFSF